MGGGVWRYSRAALSPPNRGKEIMADYPALPLWTDAYLADTTHLTIVEHGAYILLLMHAWRTPECRLPADEKWIARKLGCSAESYRETVVPVLEEFWKNDGNFWKQKRLTRERRYLEKKSAAQSARAKSRWNNEKDVCQDDAATHQSGNAETMPPHPHPHPHPQDKKDPPLPRDNNLYPARARIMAPPQSLAHARSSREGEGDFERWWKAYPHKVGKGSARKAYAKARKIVDAETLIEGVARYRAVKPSDRPWCNPATWLNGERWLDAEAPAEDPYARIDAAHREMARRRDHDGSDDGRGNGIGDRAAAAALPAPVGPGPGSGQGGPDRGGDDRGHPVAGVLGHGPGGGNGRVPARLDHGAVADHRGAPGGAAEDDSEVEWGVEGEVDPWLDDGPDRVGRGDDDEDGGPRSAAEGLLPRAVVLGHGSSWAGAGGGGDDEAGRGDDDARRGGGGDEGQDAGGGRARGPGAEVRADRGAEHVAVPAGLGGGLLAHPMTPATIAAENARAMAGQAIAEAIGAQGWPCVSAALDGDADAVALCRETAARLGVEWDAGQGRAEAAGEWGG